MTKWQKVRRSLTIAILVSGGVLMAFVDDLKLVVLGLLVLAMALWVPGDN